MDKFRRLAIYARVSKDGLTTSQQIAELRAWLESRADVIDEYTETQSTRKVRPVQEELVRRALSGEYDAIAVWQTDRFARTTRELINKVEDLRQAGVTFLSMREGYDLSTPAGRFLFKIIAATTELERDMISIRTKAKLAELKRRGVHLGKPFIPVDEEKARKIVPRMSVRKAAKALGVSKAVVERLRATLFSRPITGRCGDRKRRKSLRRKDLRQIPGETGANEAQGQGEPNSDESARSQHP